MLPGAELLSHTCSVDSIIGGLPHKVSKRNNMHHNHMKTRKCKEKKSVYVCFSVPQNSDCTLTDHGRFLPLSSSSTDGYIALSNIMISRVTPIKHLGAHPRALIPQHLRVREGRGTATVNLWGPKQWHAAWNRNSPTNVKIPVHLKLVKNSLKQLHCHYWGIWLYYYPHEAWSVLKQ